MSADTLSLASMFESLASDHRQQILNVLRSADEPVSEHGLAALTAERLDAPSSQSLSPEEYERLRTEQYHVHLPKLADSGLVRWDKERQRITEGKAVSSHQELIAGALEPPMRRDGNGANE